MHFKFYFCTIFINSHQVVHQDLHNVHLLSLPVTQQFSQLRNRLYLLLSRVLNPVINLSRSRRVDRLVNLHLNLLAYRLDNHFLIPQACLHVSLRRVLLDNHTVPPQGCLHVSLRRYLPVSRLRLQRDFHRRNLRVIPLGSLYVSRLHLRAHNRLLSPHPTPLNLQANQVCNHLQVLRCSHQCNL